VESAKSLEEQAADTDVPAYGFELNHQVSRVSLEVNRVLQAEAGYLRSWEDADCAT
jgi:hypothetical protein